MFIGLGAFCLALCWVLLGWAHPALPMSLYSVQSFRGAPKRVSPKMAKRSCVVSVGVQRRSGVITKNYTKEIL